MGFLVVVVVDELFGAILCFLFFNLFAFIGNVLSGFVQTVSFFVFLNGFGRSK